MFSNSFSLDADTALEFVDRLVYAKTKEHLSDLERLVFLGSWEGKTYGAIYADNPEYIEKVVGYKLWHKLSDVLGEKIKKKILKGAVERAFKQQEKIAIIYREHMPDVQLAKSLRQSVQSVGYPLLANLDASSGVGDTWVNQLDSKLADCNYFILLLSTQMAMSELVIDILQRIKDRAVEYNHHAPWLWTLRMNVDDSPVALNHALRNLFAQAQRYDWFKAGDEDYLLQDLQSTIQTGAKAVVSTDSTDSTVDIKDNQSRYSRLSNSNLQQHPISIAPLPSPVAEPELPQGQVRLESLFYIERQPQESQCYDEVLRPGALIRIKAPRQMGKTSLMARILYHAGEQGYRTVPLTFQHADKDIFNSLDKLLYWFCIQVSRRLHLPSRVQDFWTDTYGSKDKCTIYFEDYLLQEISHPLVLGMDEVDRVFEYPDIAADFFGLLRAWYEEAGYGIPGSSVWQKLRLVVVHSTEGYIPMDINQSPFNVGLPIKLQEFTKDQVEDLANRHGLDWAPDQTGQLMTLIGGHPYLVRLAFYHVSRQQISWDDLLNSASTESGIYGDHLRRHLWCLQHNDALATALSKVLDHQRPVRLESEYSFKLHSLGLVKLQGNGVIPRFELYRQYFKDRLEP